MRVAANFIAQPTALDAKGGRSFVPGRSLLAVEFETVVREEFFGAGNGKRQFLFFWANVTDLINDAVVVEQSLDGGNPLGGVDGQHLADQVSHL